MDKITGSPNGRVSQKPRGPLPTQSGKDKPSKIQRIVVSIFDALCKTWKFLKNLRISIHNRNEGNAWREKAENLRRANFSLEARLNQLEIDDVELRQFKNIFPSCSLAEETRDLLAQFEKAFPDFHKLRSKNENLTGSWLDQEKQFETAKKSLLDICANCKKENGKLQGELEDLRSDYAKVNACVSNLHAQLQKKRDEISGLSLDLSQHRYELMNLQTDCKDKTALAESQEKLLEESAKKLSELQELYKIQGSFLRYAEMESELYQTGAQVLANAEKERSALEKKYKRMVSYFSSELEAAKQGKRSSTNFSIGTAVATPMS